MVKLIKIGDFWYTEYRGRLYSRISLIEDIKQWNRINSLSKPLYRQLKKEFPDVLKDFQIAPGSSEYTVGGRKSPRAPVTEVLWDDTLGPDKYVTYHATVVMKAKTAVAKKKTPAKKAVSKPGAKKASPKK